MARRVGSTGIVLLAVKNLKLAYAVLLGGTAGGCGAPRPQGDLLG
jgi:hypothetical protein